MAGVPKRRNQPTTGLRDRPAAPVDRPRAGVGVTLAATLVAVAASGCVASSLGSQGSGHAPTPHAPRPILHAHHVRADRADPIAPIHLSVGKGRLRKVWVDCSSCMRHRLKGHVVRRGKAWVSYHPAPPSSKLVVHARARDGVGHMRRLEPIKMRVASADSILSPVMSPAGGTYGVGQPVVVYFNHPVQDRKAVQKRLHVQSDPVVHGAWHWMTDNVVHWRPRHFWPAHTKVSVSVDLGDRWLHGQWGAADHHTSFHIGDSQISTVDVTGHTMVVRQNGAVVQTIPVSTGREDKYPTAGGIHIALSKAPKVIMDSATVGIPRNSPDGYYEKVFWDVRISNGGEFVHAAPWSVSDQGVTNVSHGCVNISPAAARWFYYFSQVGDVVNVIHSARPPDLGDAGMADWNMSWQQWKAGSAFANG